MNRLWAPWRMAYITGEAQKKEKGCIFCLKPKQKFDYKNLIVLRGKEAFVIMNLFPYNNGHLMVAPYKHTADMGELDDAELLEINRLVAACLRWLQRAYRPEGFNIGVNLGSAAGAGIPDHIHWHVVPRWAGDTNFMTVVGEVRVLPQDLWESYDRLRRAMEEDR